MKTTEEGDIFKQVNKAHKGIRDKLKKKRKQEKEIKKRKKEKKKENEKKKAKKAKKHLKKEKKEYDSDSDQESGPDSKLLKYIKKLRKIMEEEADDLFEMFEVIDQGGEVSIEELQNEKVKNYLKKIFKYLHLKKNPDTKEYSKDPDVHHESLKDRFQDLWYQLMEDSSSESEKGKEKDDNDDNKDDHHSDYSDASNEKDIDISKTKAALFGDTTKKVKTEEEKKLDFKLLDDKFEALLEQEGYGKLSKLDKSKSIKSTNEERTERDKQIDEFMKEYDQQFRRKSLLEEHQERKRLAAGSNPAKNERRAFDRSIDLGRVDSKKVFQMLTNKEISLQNRFTNSQSGNKYL